MSRAVLLCATAMAWGQIAWAQPEGFPGAVAGPKPEILFQMTRGGARNGPLPKKSKLVSLDELQFTGPQPSHPFVLGNYASDGRFGIVDGGLQLVEGKNAALQLAWADQFELEGVIEHAGFGGWFWLLGWDDGRGYALHNVLMKESGSPWFISEFRGAKAIMDRTREYGPFEWKGEQPFRLAVQSGALSLTVGKFRVFDQEPLANYTPGLIVLGVYDTRYGPKPIRITSLRIREPAPVPPATPPAADKAPAK